MSAPRRIVRSDLPFGSEFSPSQVSLARLLEIAHSLGGDWKAFERQVRAEYFESHSTSEYNKGKLANNTKLAMIAYRLIGRDATLTDLGKALFDMREDVAQLHSAFARHILLNLHGMTLVQCILDFNAAGETVTLRRLRVWLEERGVHFPRGGRHPSTMSQWLQKAGVLGPRWKVDESRLQDVLGTTSAEYDALASLNAQQRAFLRTLANMSPSSPSISNEIEKLASATYGVQFDEKNLAKQVLYPLESAGYITLTRGTRAPGRGAKPFVVTPTDKLVADLIKPLLDQLDRILASDLRPLLRLPMQAILGQLSSSDRHVRGLALEALAFKLMRLLDMTYVATRLRGIATGGAEVDVVFESARLVFSRWQIQCKNSARVSLDDVAKEVGLTHFLKSNAIVMVTTGLIGPEARKYADKIMSDTNLCVVMVDGADIQRIVEAPPTIVDIFCREARQAMRLKALSI